MTNEVENRVSATHGWFATDEHQYAKKISDTCYQYIEAVWLDDLESNDVWAICTSTVDVKDFTIKDIELAICEHFESIEAMEKNYGLTVISGDLNQTIAECYFESNCYCDSYSLEGTYTLEEAEQKITEYMKEH